MRDQSWQDDMYSRDQGIRDTSTTRGPSVVAPSMGGGEEGSNTLLL